MRIKVGVGDLVHRTRASQAQVRYSMARRLRRRAMLCAAYTVHKETGSATFLDQPQNQGRWFLPVWPQNQWL
jgi:hypothetical protein